MSNKSRECSLLFDALAGCTKQSKSVEDRTGLNHIRLMTSLYTSRGVIKWYGDELTWSEIALTGLIWGEDTAILFPALQAGWSYVYKALNQTFVVLNDTGNTVFSRKTNIISRFGIPWDIVSSHQFWIEFVDGISGSEFLIGQKRQHSHIDPSQYPPNPPPNFNPDDPSTYPPDWVIPDSLKTTPKINAMYGDKYYTDDDTIADLNRIISSENVLNVPVLANEQWTSAIDHIVEPPTFIRSNVPVHDALGDYSTFLLKRNDLKEPTARTKKRDAMPVSYYMTWLIALISSSMYGRGNVIYKPWLLFEMWKWLGASTPTSALDKIFDIMPNWGE